MKKRIFKSVSLLILLFFTFTYIHNNQEKHLSAALPADLGKGSISYFQIRVNAPVKRAVLYFGTDSGVSSGVKYATNKPWLCESISSTSLGDKFNNLGESVGTVSSDGLTISFLNPLAPGTAYAYFNIVGSTSANGENGFTYLFSYAGTWVDSNRNDSVGSWQGLSGHQMLTANFTMSGTTALMSANWNQVSKPRFSVNLVSNGGTGTSLTSYYGGSGVTLPTNYTKTGHTFGGWYTTSNFSGTPVTLISSSELGNKVFYAKWNPNVYTVTLNLNGGSGGTNLTSYTFGTALTLPTNFTKAGYTFGGWYTTSNLTGTAVTTIANSDYGNKVYYAKWNPNTYSITLNLNGGSGGTNLTSYIYGIGATLPTNFVRNGYTFGGWYTASNLSGTAVTTITTTELGNKVFYAKWNPITYTVTLNLNGGTGGTNLTSYITGTGATLPVNFTKTGYTFGGWFTTSNLTGTAVTNITTTDYGNKIYYAKWNPNTYSITLNLNGGTGGTALSSYIYGTGAVLPVNYTKSGYTFAGWFNDASLTGTAVTQITASDLGNKTFYAKWTPNTYTVTLTLNGGSSGSNLVSYVFGVGATLPTNYTRVGYTFGGWYMNAAFSGSAVTQITISDLGNKVYYAKWIQHVALPTADVPGVYTGLSQNASILNNSVLFTLGGQINGINVGEYSFTATLKDVSNTCWPDGTTSVKTIKWYIVPADFSRVNISASNADYTGIQVQTALSVYLGAKELILNEDYSVTWGININAGASAGSVTITPKSANFTGTARTLYFDINKINQSNFKVTNEPNSHLVVGNANNFKITTSIASVNDLVLFESSDPSIATVDAEGNIVFTGKIGSVKFTVTNRGNNNFNDAVDEFTVEIKSGVTRIISVYYASLEDAILVASENSIIEILSDLNLNQTLQINKNMTIQSDDLSVQRKFFTDNGFGFEVINQKTLTLKSLVINGQDHEYIATTPFVAENGSLILNHTTVENFNIKSDRGLIYVDGVKSKLILQNQTIIRKNMTEVFSAVTINNGAQLTMTNSVLENNKNTASESLGGGGAIYLGQEAKASLDSSARIINNNILNGYGEAIYVNSNAQLELKNPEIDGTIYLAGDSTASLVSIIKISGNAYTNSIIIHLDSKITDKYLNDAVIYKLVEAEQLSSQDLKAFTRVKNAGFTAKVNEGENFLTLMSTSEYAAAIGDINTADFTAFGTIQEAIWKISELENKTGTIYIIDSFQASTLTWKNDQTVYLYNSIVIPAGCNITFKAAQRYVNEDDVTYVLKEMTDDFITLKRGAGLKKEMISVEKGAFLNVQNLIIDGGAIWHNNFISESIKANSLTAGDVTYINSGNSGISANAPIIRNYGTLLLKEKAILQNNENKYSQESFGSANYGGGIANLGGAKLTMEKDSVIQTCFAREGGGIQNINGGKNTHFTDENLIIINGNITNCVSHTKGAAIETIYGQATTNIENNAIIENNISLMNLGVITVEEGGNIYVKGGRISSINDNYVIYLYNKYGENDIKPDKNGNIAYVEGISAAKIKISGNPIIQGKIFLDNDCIAMHPDKTSYFPFIDAVDYTANQTLSIDINQTKSISSTIVKANNANLSNFKIHFLDSELKGYQNVFTYNHDDSIKVGGYSFMIEQVGLDKFQVIGNSFGLKEQGISTISINGKIFTIAENGSFTDELLLKSVNFGFPYNGTMEYHANGQIVVANNNFTELNVTVDLPNKLEDHYTLGVLTMDPHFNIYAPANTTYKTKNNGVAILHNTLLPNDILEENGKVTFYLEGKREVEIHIGIRELTPPQGGKLVDVTNHSITINTSENVEYSLVDQNNNPVTNWISGDGQNLTFENLNPETTYKVLKRTNFDQAPGVYLVSEEITTLKVNETTEELLRKFKEQFELIKEYLTRETYLNMSDDTLQAVFAEYNALTPTLKIIVEDQYLDLMKAQHSYNLKKEFDKYKSIESQYLEEDFREIQNIFETGIDSIFNSVSEKDSRDHYNTAIDGMKSVLTAVDQFKLAEKKLNDAKLINDSEEVLNIINQGVNQIYLGQYTTNAALNELLESVLLDADRQRGKDAIKKVYEDKLLEENYLNLSVEAQMVLENTYNEIINGFDSLQNKEEITAAVTLGSKQILLAFAKEYGKANLNEFISNEESIEVKAIIQAAHILIDNSSDEASIAAIIEKTKLDVEKQRGKENLDLFINVTESAVVQGIIETAKKSIEAALSKADIDRIVAKAKLDVEKERGKANLEAFITTEDSPEVKAIVDGAKKSIDSSVNTTEINRIIENAKLKVVKERAKEVINSMIAEGDSQEVKNIIEASEILIESALDKNEIDLIIENTRLDVDKQRGKDEINNYINSNESDEIKAIVETAENLINSSLDKEQIDTIIETAKLDIDKERGKEELNQYIDQNESEDIKAIIEAAKALIDPSTDKEMVTVIVENAKLDVEKQRGKENLSAYIDEEESNDIKAIIEKAKEQINQAPDKETIENLMNTAKIDVERQRAKEDLDLFITPEDSEEVLALIDKAKESIDQNNNKEEILAIVESTKTLVERQRGKEALDQIINPEESAEIKAIIEKAKDLIDQSTGKEVIDQIIAEASLNVDRQRGAEELEEFFDQLMQEESFKDLSASSKNKLILKQNEFIAQIKKEMSPEDIQEELGSSKNALEKAFNIAILEDYVKNNDSDKVKNIVSEAIDSLKDVTDLDIIEKAVRDTKEKVDLTRAKEDKLHTLTNHLNGLKDSGKYSDAGTKELEDRFNDSFNKIENATQIEQLDELLNQAIDDLRDVKVTSIGSGNVKPDGSGSGNLDDVEYPEDKKDDIFGNITSSDGLSSNIELTIKEKQDDKQESIAGAIKKNQYVSANSNNLTEKEMQKLLKNKEQKGTFDVKLIYKNSDGTSTVVPNEDLSGTYTIRVLLPKDMRVLKNIVVVYMLEDGNLEVFETERVGNYITFTTTHFSDYVILGEPATNLWWAIIVLIVLILLEIGFIAFNMIKKNRQSSNKEKAVTAQSSILPMIVLASLIKPASGITVLIILGVIFVGLGFYIAYILIKQAKDENEPEEVVAFTDQIPVEEEITEIITDNNPIISDHKTVVEFKETDSDSEFEISENGTYIYRSFIAKLIQSDTAVQNYYTAIKNELLAYKKMNSRLSWNYESYNIGRMKYVEILIRGKTLCLQLALNPNDYIESKYTFESVEHIKKFADVPMRLKIRNNYNLKCAIELIHALLRDHNQGQVEKIDYSMPFQTTEELQNKELIKVKVGKKVDFSKISAKG